jgi:hypothetical protein
MPQSKLSPKTLSHILNRGKLDGEKSLDVLNKIIDHPDAPPIQKKNATLDRDMLLHIRKMAKKELQK